MRKVSDYFDITNRFTIFLYCNFAGLGRYSYLCNGTKRRRDIYE